jgi:drug/metabolite transporter (DMT)-like permease
MLGATAFLAGTTLLAKALGTDTLGPPLHPVQVSFGRFLLRLARHCHDLSRSASHASRKVHWPIHVARVACGFTGVTLMFAAAAMIPLADATAISFLNPGLLHDPRHPASGRKHRPLALACGAAIALLGALILIRPGAAIEIGAIFALGAALFLGWNSSSSSASRAGRRRSRSWSSATPSAWSSPRSP